MQQSDAGGKYNTSLKEGDPVQVSQNATGMAKWFEATVISNSEAALTVKFADNVQEVVPWNSGRIRESGGVRE